MASIPLIRTVDLAQDKGRMIGVRLVLSTSIALLEEVQTRRFLRFVSIWRASTARLVAQVGSLPPTSRQ